MKYKHFREIEPSNKTDFIMLYFAACRSLHELENAIRRTNNGNLTCRYTACTRKNIKQRHTPDILQQSNHLYMALACICYIYNAYFLYQT